MAEFTIDDLTTLLRECAGEDEDVDLGGDIVDTTFEDLGYDSLALFNTVSRIEREFGIQLGDEVVNEAKTPHDMLDQVRSALAVKA